MVIRGKLCHADVSAVEVDRATDSVEPGGVGGDSGKAISFDLPAYKVVRDSARAGDEALKGGYRREGEEKGRTDRVSKCRA